MERRWGSNALLLAQLLVAGCGRVGFDEHAAGPPTADAARDASDASDATDAITVSVCDLVAEPEVVALYGFELALGADATGQHPATVVDTLTPTAGRCGATAAQFGSGYLLVPNAPAFDLGTGSIELFVRTPDPSLAANQTLFARDASGFLSEGHIMAFLNSAGDLVMRLQRGGQSYYRCAPPWSADTWVHVGVSFGGTALQGLRMWVDQIEVTLASSMTSTEPIGCTGVPPAGGVGGNTNTLVIGASNANAGDGALMPLVDQPLFGEIDQVRIRSTWRDFSAP